MPKCNANEIFGRKIAIELLAIKRDIAHSEIVCAAN